MLKVDIVKKLPNFALQLSFSVDKETLVLFGPSGAGKSLTLNSIAGLVKPDSGLIQLNGRTLFQSPHIFVPVHKRGIGVVFQGYALFPHKTVAQNLQYGLCFTSAGADSVSNMLRRLRLENLADRYPHQLSGGQQQRVALGRALITRPPLLLLDEPFAALDMGVREHLQTDISRLQQELELTVIIITHNLDDAFVLGDKLAVIKDGTLCQFGSVDEVFRYPATTSVAEITGVTNIWHATVIESSVSGLRLQWGNLTLERAPADVVKGTSVTFYIRPEDVKIIRADKPLTDVIRFNLVDGIISKVVDRGVAMWLTVESPLAPAPIQVRFSPRSYQDLDLHVGKPIRLSLLREGVKLLPNDGASHMF